MFYVFHGEDEYSIRQTISDMQAKMGDATTAELNTSVLDGRSLSLGELRLICSTLPFLCERRLVIVEGLLARFEPRGGTTDNAKGRDDTLTSGLRDCLSTLPDTTRLAFVERVSVSDKNPLLKMAKELDGHVKEFSAPTGAVLSAWIQKHIQAAGGSASPRAVETLGAFVGGNLRQLTQEIDKLVAYAGQRQIQEGDVHLLVADAREAVVWTLTDAIAARQREQAVGIVRRLLDEGQPPPVLMAIITRQFRDLIQIKDLADEQKLSSDAIAGKLRMHPYRAQRVVATARSFTFERLQAILHQLLDADLAIKTGRLDPGLALELLVLEIAAV